MATTGLHGPFRLDVAEIRRQFPHTAPGAYALGDIRPGGGSFIVGYVGRSDIDLPGRLCQHAHEAAYTAFKASYMASAAAAFEKECHLFHDFGGEANHAHPARPAGEPWRCPRCFVFG